ncbi:MAG: hypothetical protein AB1393_05235 [Candidatus Edwardsbacteria bacterium]
MKSSIGLKFRYCKLVTTINRGETPHLVATESHLLQHFCQDIFIITKLIYQVKEILANAPSQARC